MRRRVLALLLVLGPLGCASATFDLVRQAPVDVQGHRGARGLLPENTLPGFALALDLGVSTLELDLGMSRDGALVVTHDPRLSGRICLGPDGQPLAEPGPLVRELTLQQLRGHDCGRLNPDPGRFPEPPRRNLPGTPMPTLGEVFDLVRQRGDEAVRFNVEVKLVPGSTETPAVAPFVHAVIDELERHGMLARTTLQSFDWSALAVARERAPQLRTAALLAEDTISPDWQAGLSQAEHGDALGLLRAARPFVDDFSPHWRGLVPGRGYLGRPVADYQAAGFAVIPWTVNDVPTMRRLIGLGVDGIITDRPDLLLDLAREEGLPIRGRSELSPAP